MSGAASAADWRLTPSVGFGETYTDNVRLTSTNRQYDWVQSIEPRLQVATDGPRITANIIGGADYLYFDRLNKDSLRPNLQGTATIEAVPDLLRIEANTSVTEQLIDPAGTFSISPYNDSVNRQTVQIYSGGPTLYHHFGPIANAQLGYQFNYVRTGGTTTLNAQFPQQFLGVATLHDLNFLVSSGPRFSTFAWDFSTIYQDTVNRNKANNPPTRTHFQQLTLAANGNYALSSAFSFLATLGYDHSGGAATGGTGPGRSLFGGPTYMGGFELRGTRTTIRALAGHRYGGFAVDASVTYLYSARTTMTATYTQDVTTSAARLISLLGLAAASDFAQQYNLDPRFTLSDELYFSRRGDLQLQGSRGKNTFTINGYVERRSFRIVQRSDWAYGATLGWSRQLNRKWTFDSTGLYTHQHFNNFAFLRDDILAAQAGLTDQFARSFKASLTYRFSYRNSSDPTFDVKENSVTLLLTTTF